MSNTPLPILPHPISSCNISPTKCQHTQEVHVGGAVADELDEWSSHEATNGALWHKQVEHGHEWVHETHRHSEQHFEYDVSAPEPWQPLVPEGA